MADDDALRQALSLVQANLMDTNRIASEANQRAAEQNVLLLEQNRQLEEVEEQLGNFVPKRNYKRTIALLVLAGLVVLSLVVWARAERHREDDRERIASVSRAYANCQGVNRAFDGVDRGVTTVGRVLRNTATTPEGQERAALITDALRSGLFRSDCDAILVVLSPRDAERVRSETSRTLPTLPLPPPPTD